MSFNIFLLEILVDQSRLFTLPIITDSMSMEFTLLNDGSKIVVQDNEFKKRHEYACNTCMFTLAKKQVDIPKEEQPPTPPPPPSKGKPLKVAALKPERPAPEPELSPEVMLVEVYKENIANKIDVAASDNQRYFMGQGQIYVKHLFDKITDTIEVYDKATADWAEKRHMYEEALHDWKRLKEQEQLINTTDMTAASSAQGLSNNDAPTDYAVTKPVPPSPKPSSIYPFTEQYKALYPLRDRQLRNCGAICVLLRLSCFGTSIEVSPEMRELRPRRFGAAGSINSDEDEPSEKSERPVYQLNAPFHRCCRHKCI